MRSYFHQDFFCSKFMSIVLTQEKENKIPYQTNQVLPRGLPSEAASLNDSSCCPGSPFGREHWVVSFLSRSPLGQAFTAGGGKLNAGIEPPVYHWTPDWSEHVKHRGLDLCALWIMLSSSCRFPRPTTVFTSWASFVVFLLSERAGIPQVGRWNQDIRRAKTSVCPWVFHQKCMSVLHMLVCICKSHVWDLVLRKDPHWPWLRLMGCTVSLLAHNNSVFTTFPWSHFILNVMLRLSQVKVTKNLNWNFGIIFGAILGLFLLPYLLWIQKEKNSCVWFGGEGIVRMLNYKNLSCLLCWPKAAFNPFQKFICDFVYVDTPLLAALLDRFWSCLLYKKIFVVKVSHRSK